jgi:hypothetical protein
MFTGSKNSSGDIVGTFSTTMFSGTVGVVLKHL